jgi:hypothetical protein
MRNLLMAMTLTLGACAAAQPPAEIPRQGVGAYTCNSAALGQFAGRPATQELGAEMLRVSGARIIRWVAHGMMITMDFSPERLTVQLTPDNHVERANCG